MRYGLQYSFGEDKSPSEVKSPVSPMLAFFLQFRKDVFPVSFLPRLSSERVSQILRRERAFSEAKNAREMVLDGKMSVQEEHSRFGMVYLHA